MKRLLVGAFLLLAQQAMAQTPADEALMRWERQINTTRTDRLLALAPVVIPQCDIAPSKEDMTQFYAFWRVVVQEEIDEHNAMGLPLVDTDEDKRLLQLRQLGVVSLRQYQLPELARVGPEMPNADEAVARQVRLWKALHCVVETYGGHKFFSSNGSARMGMNWPYDTILHAFGYDLVPIDPERTKAYLLPDLIDVEPLDGLGRFFRDAQTKGLLTFANEAEERYFFERYESDHFYNMTDASKARAWFHTPPWSPDAPHIERPTRPIPSRSEK
jgi:hypothetical protein